MGKCSYGGRLVVIRSDSKSIFQQPFDENHGNNCCYSIHFDSMQHNHLALKIIVTSL